jgi:hypothetical protein
MRKLNKKVIGLSVGLVASAAAFTAAAGPGDGAAVVLDQPDSLDLVIQELRADNADATHVPVKVRITVPTNPQHGDDDGAALRWARLTAYLTSTTDPDAPRFSEAILHVGPEWANRSVVIEVPSPGEGAYFMHVEGEFRLWDRTSAKFISTSTQRVEFGKPVNCDNIQNVPILSVGDQPCPVLFDIKSSVLTPAGNPRLRTQNQRVLDAAVERIDELCNNGTLHRVSVRGWASTIHSVNPVNEELARNRADAAVAALRARVSGCAVQIHDDSEPGTRGVTSQFDANSPQANQCAQIQITSHTCGK